jgi:hypothetical protein
MNFCPAVRDAVAGLPQAVLNGSWYCRACVQENDSAAAAAFAAAEAAAKAARTASKKGKGKGECGWRRLDRRFAFVTRVCRNKAQAIEVLLL